MPERGLSSAYSALIHSIDSIHDTDQIDLESLHNRYAIVVLFTQNDLDVRLIKQSRYQNLLMN